MVKSVVFKYLETLVGGAIVFEDAGKGKVEKFPGHDEFTTYEGCLKFWVVAQLQRQREEHR